MYNRLTEKDRELGTQEGQMPKSTNTAAILAVEEKLESVVNGKGKALGEHVHNGKKKLGDYEAEFDKSQQDLTDVLEVWFAGCHCGAFC